MREAPSQTTEAAAERQPNIDVFTAVRERSPDRFPDTVIEEARRLLSERAPDFAEMEQFEQLTTLLSLVQELGETEPGTRLPQDNGQRHVVEYLAQCLSALQDASAEALDPGEVSAFGQLQAAAPRLLYGAAANDTRRPSEIAAAQRSAA